MKRNILLSTSLCVALACLSAWLHLPAPVQGFIQVADSRIYYEATGRGKPLLFLHGGFLDHRMWEHQREVFSGNHLVITCDLRGSGLTKNGDSAYLMAEGIRILMDSLHIKQADLVGHSLGAIVALDLSITHPERVRRLVLYSPGYREFKELLPGDSVIRRNGKKMEEAWTKKKDTAAVAELFTQTWFDGPFRHPAEANKWERPKALQMALFKARSGFSNEPLMDSFPVQPRLKELRMPVLVVTGDLDNAMIHAIADSFSTYIPGMRRAVIPGTAHMANMEKFIDFNSILEDFLSR
jgi:pimeloyl-ACP methyl ester carboxylesterase